MKPTILWLYGSVIQNSQPTDRGGDSHIKKGGDARREILNEPLKGTNLGVA